MALCLWIAHECKNQVRLRQHWQIQIIVSGPGYVAGCVLCPDVGRREDRRNE